MHEAVCSQVVHAIRHFAAHRQLLRRVQFAVAVLVGRQEELLQISLKQQQQNSVFR